MSSYMNGNAQAQNKIDIHNEHPMPIANANSKVLCAESRPPTNYVTPNNHCRCENVFFSPIILGVAIAIAAHALHEECI